MNDDQFTKLFKYIEEFRSEVNNRFDDAASRGTMDSLVSILDGLALR